MDVIQKAIKMGKHISKRPEYNQQSWEQFWERTNNNKIILFGVGACASSVFENYKDISIEAVIDNNIKKQGLRLDDFIDETRCMECGKLEIKSREVLKKYSADDISILISSTNYYEQIIEQLELEGIKNYYVVLIMEANRRKGMNYCHLADEKQAKEQYVENCCKEQIKSNKIFFCSFGTYSDHGKYITEALLKSRKDLDIVWLVKDMTTEVPEGVRKVYMGNWKRQIYEMETAKIWIYSTPVPSYIIKRREQIYIQTKHWASITLKKFYLDIGAMARTSENVAYWKQDSQKMDYIITGSDFDTESSRRGFDFHKEVIQIGSPRSDAMFQEKEKKEKVYSQYGLNLDKRMLLYAPTYRYDQNRSVQKDPVQEIREIGLDYEGVKMALEKRFGGEWYIVLRLHPGHEKEVEKLGVPTYVVDLSAYADGEEVAAACDVMISDYSSIMFEPAFVKKPVFLFAMDKKEYIDKEYDLLLEYDTLPFPSAESNEELIKNIRHFNADDYEKNITAFMNKHGVHEDGHASERAAAFILDLIDMK